MNDGLAPQDHWILFIYFLKEQTGCLHLSALKVSGKKNKVLIGQLPSSYALYGVTEAKSDYPCRALVSSNRLSINADSNLRSRQCAEIEIYIYIFFFTHTAYITVL